MEQYALIFDSNRCVGCQACEVACKSENNLPVGISWIRLLPAVPREKDGKLRLDFRLVRCMHCGKAPCIEACPQEALSRSERGIVLVNEERCIGCKVCIEVCPFAAPQFNPQRGVVEMCNLCCQRIERGLPPACVQACITDALFFGKSGEVVKELEGERADRNLP